MDQTITITYNTSEDEDSKKAGDHITKTTTIVFKDWTPVDFCIAAAETVKIRQIQPRIRKAGANAVGAEFIAARPGTKAQVDPIMALIGKYGSAEKAIEALQALAK